MPRSHRVQISTRMPQGGARVAARAPHHRGGPRLPRRAARRQRWCLDALIAGITRIRVDVDTHWSSCCWVARRPNFRIRPPLGVEPGSSTSIRPPRPLDVKARQNREIRRAFLIFRRSIGKGAPSSSRGSCRWRAAGLVDDAPTRACTRSWRRLAQRPASSRSSIPPAARTAVRTTPRNHRYRGSSFSRAPHAACMWMAGRSIGGGRTTTPSGARPPATRLDGTVTTRSEVSTSASAVRKDVTTRVTRQIGRAHV